MSQLKLSFHGERILTALRLTQLNERRSSEGGEGVSVCWGGGGGGVVDYAGYDLRLDDDRVIQWWR